MKIGELLHYIGYSEFGGNPEITFTGLCADSQKVKQGDLFLCYQGTECDSHQFAEDAKNRGAVALVCEKKLDCELQQIIVPDGRAAVAEIARVFYGFADKKLIDHRMPVDLYVGGPEHAVGHLLYSRMWNEYLYEKGIAPTKEPFKKLVHQGMILGANGIKMGKRYPEFSVNPTDIINQYGADTIRLYEMFMGPLEADKPWSQNGVEGAKKFLERVWRLYESDMISSQENKNLEQIYHQTVKKVTNDYETLNFNTAISQMMIFMNELNNKTCISRNYAEGFIKMLSCVTPHLGEEIWEMYGHNSTIAYEPWPTYDEEKLVDEEVNIAISVNGKLRNTIKVALNTEEEVLKDLALKDEKVTKYLEGKEIVKTIIVPNKIINIVVK